MEQFVIFLFGMLAIVPTCLLAMQDRRTRTLHVHHWHHPASPQTPQEPLQLRYQVLMGSNSAYVLDNATGERYAIVQPEYKAVLHD
jgi:hypothetical protein